MQAPTTKILINLADPALDNSIIMQDPAGVWYAFNERGRRDVLGPMFSIKGPADSPADRGPADDPWDRGPH